MKPYYQYGGITIYHGDCRELLSACIRPGEEFDLLLTDPPYGIGESSKKNATRGKPFSGKPQGRNTRGTPIPPRDYGEYDWDQEPPSSEMLQLLIRSADKAIIWGGNFFELPPCKGPLIWDKENSGDFADGELAWNNLGTALRIRRHLWNGMLRKNQEERFHPTQKPLDLMLWCLSLVPEAKTVIDPYMGSGTTLAAAKLKGLMAVGIDREERYCEIAANRLAQEVFAL